MEILDTSDIHQWELPYINGKFDASRYIVVTNHEKFLIGLTKAYAIMPTRTEYLRRVNVKDVSDIYANLYLFFSLNKNIKVIESDCYLTHFKKKKKQCNPGGRYSSTSRRLGI